MTTLTDFLLARIAEWEDEARRALDFDFFGEPVTYYSNAGPHRDDWGLYTFHVDPARVLAECEAKRRILRVHPMMLNADDSVRACSTCGGDGVCATVWALALPYADHADYREEWRP